MSTTLFPVLTSVLWREAIARGRAEGQRDLRMFREQVALSEMRRQFPGAKEAPSHASLNQSKASTSLPRAVEQHGQLSHAAGSLADDRSVGDSQATEPKAQAEAGGGDSFSTLNPGADGSANGKHAPIATMNAAPGSIPERRAVRV